MNDGVIDAADLAAGRPVAHIPAGLLEFLPAGRDARGTFHAAYAFLAGRRFRGVRVTLRDGRIVEVDGDDDAGIIRDRLRTESGEPDRLAGFSIGLNPAGADLTGKASLDACLAGTVTISFGNNELRGGDVRSSLDLQLPAGAATVVTAGGIELVRHGQLVTGEEPGPAPGRAAPVP